MGSLIDPIVKLMIKDNIIMYCINEIKIMGNKKTLARGHMMLTLLLLVYLRRILA